MRQHLTTVALVALLAASTFARSVNYDLPEQQLAPALENVNKIIDAFEELGASLQDTTSDLQLVDSALQADMDISEDAARDVVKMELDAVKERINMARDQALRRLPEVSVQETLHSADNYNMVVTGRKIRDIINEGVKNVTNALNDVKDETQELIERKIADMIEVVKQRANNMWRILKRLVKKIFKIIISAFKKIAIKHLPVEDRQVTETYGRVVRFLERDLSLRPEGGKNYVIDEMVKNAVRRLRLRIQKFMAMMKEAKKVAEESAGKAKEAAKAHLSELRMKLRQSLKELKAIIIGRLSETETIQELKEAKRQVLTAAGEVKYGIPWYKPVQ